MLTQTQAKNSRYYCTNGFLMPVRAAPPHEEGWYPVRDILHASNLCKALADSDLLLPDGNDRKIYAAGGVSFNSFCLQVFNASVNDWEDWVNEDTGDTFDDLGDDSEKIANADIDYTTTWKPKQSSTESGT